MKKFTSSGTLLILSLFLLVTPAMASDVSLASLEDTEQQISSIQAQLKPLEDQLLQFDKNTVLIAYGHIIQTDPQFIVEGGGSDVEAILNYGSPMYYVIQDPQDGKNHYGMYSGRHVSMGKVQIQVNGYYVSATVLGAIPKDILALASKVKALQDQLATLKAQQKDLSSQLCKQYATKLRNHEPTVTEGLLFQIGNPIMTLDNQHWQMIESGNIRAVPTIVNGYTMIPIRAVVEGLGGNVRWDATTQSVNCTLGDITVSLSVGKDTATVNGKLMQISTPVITQNGKTMVPLRFVAEQLGAKVEWTNADQIIQVVMPREEPVIPSYEDPEEYIPTDTF